MILTLKNLVLSFKIWYCSRFWNIAWFAGGEVQRIRVVLPGREHAAEAPSTLGPFEGGAD